MEEIFQVAVFIVLLLGWVLKAIADKRKGASQRRPPPSPEPGGEAPRVEVPEGHGPPTGRPPALPPRARPAPSPPPSKPLATGRPVATARPHLSDLHSSVEDKHLDSRIAHRHLRLRPAAAGGAEGAGQSRTRRRRAGAIMRLTAGLATRPSRSVTRAGVLWSEVLGKPRALAGPHRSPTAKRYDPR